MREIPSMLDATNNKLIVIDEEDWPNQRKPWREGSFRTFAEKVLQRRHMIMVLMLAGVVLGWVASLAYLAVRVPAFFASSEILISNTTLQLSGPDAVVTQILVENSLVENAIELLRSGRVLGRVIDKVGPEEIERISPRSRLLPWSTSYWEPESSGVSRKQALIALLRSNTTVKRVGSSQIVLVRTRALTATDAAELTNEVAGAFVQEQYEANAVVSTSAALRERIKVLGPTARIISEAVPPKSKDQPSAGVAMLLAMMLGGALGAGSGLCLVGFDRRLRVAEQLAAVTSVECFGYVPQINAPSSKARTTSLLSLGGLALSLDRLGRRARYRSRRAAPPRDLESVLRLSVLRRVRSAVLQRPARRSHKRSWPKTPHIVGVTSCHVAEGKTTVATNLARFIAREGSSVLLIDACRPDTASGSSQETPGLQEILRGTAAPDDVIVSDICPNFDFLPRGKGSGDLDLLWGNLYQAINNRRERNYQWIIVDLSALETGADVRAAGQFFDKLLIVVEWGRTSQGRLRHALHALGPSRDRIIGTVINKVPWISIDPETQARLGQQPGCDEHRSEFADREAKYDQEKIQ
jgi:Mrp family chromosome partitioning ATPase/capsular polysaccharide biosynthesis protein